MSSREHHLMTDLTLHQRMNAYGEVADRFDLRATQRDALDDTSLYPDIMRAAHVGDWDRVTVLLENASIIRGSDER